MTTPLELLSVSPTDRDKAKKAGNSLPDGSYPINNVHQLHAAAVLASSHHGDWKAAMALIRRRARELGVDVTTLPGFGGESKAAQRDPAFELRKRRRASMIRQSERRGMLLEVRAKPDGTGGTEFVFEGYGSVFDTPFQMYDRWGDPYTEVVKPGAFTRSLQRPDLDVPFLIGHDESRLALARTKNGTMHLSQDSHGLHVRAQLDGRRSDVRDLAYAVERGDMDEMSIGFVTLGQEWSPDYETRSMLDMDIHRGDVSPVALAAIPETAGSTVSFPVETLSRAAKAPAPSDPDHDGDNDSTPWGDTDHDFWNADGSHKPMTGTHAHALTPGGATVPHSHDGDADHADARSSARPLEHRGNPVDQDMGDASDYNVAGQVKCGNAKCAHQGELHPPGFKVCPYCGDALVRIDDQGVPGMEEEDGAQAALASVTQLEYLRMRTRMRQLVG